MSHHQPPSSGPPPGRRPMSYYPGDDTQINHNEEWEVVPAESGQNAPNTYSQPTQGYPQAQQQTSPVVPPYPRAPMSAYSQQRNQTYPAPGSVPILSPTSSYNPQHYASQHQQTSPQQTSPTRMSSVTGPRPYNPAAYHDGGLGVNASPRPNYSPNTYGSPTLPNFSPQPQPQGFAPRAPYPPNAPPYPTNTQYSPHLHSAQYPGAPYGSSRPLPRATPSLPPPPPPQPRLASPASMERMQSYPPPQHAQYRPSTARMSPSLDTRVERVVSASPTGAYSEPARTHSPGTNASPHRQPTVSSRGHLSAQEMARLQSRPLPGLPEHSSPNLTNQHHGMSEQERAQDELFSEVESVVMGNGSLYQSSQDGYFSQPTQRYGSQSSARYSAASNSADETHSHQPPAGVNGIYVQDTDGDEDELDYEAVAGLEAMRMDEEREAADQARRVHTSNHLSTDSASLRPPPTPGQEPLSAASHASDENDYYGIDIGMYGGGFEAPDMSYGGAPSELTLVDEAGHHSSQHPSISSLGPNSARSSAFPPRGSSHSSVGEYLPVYSAAARVDESGTGGLADPSVANRKLSFDEGDESAYSANAYTFSQSLLPPEAFPESYYTSGNSSPSRPLPPPPTDQSPYLSGHDLWVDQSYNPSSGYTGAQGSTSASLAAGPPRSVSLLNHTISPAVNQPARAKTDAEERKRQSAFRTSNLATPESGYETVDQPNLPIDLPSLPSGGRFQPTKLQPRDFDLCKEPWALSGIAEWLREVTAGETELKEGVIFDGLAALFNYKNPNFNSADAETLARNVVKELQKSSTLVQEEEWLKFGNGACSGVYYQLTGRGCYAPYLHDWPGPGKCYSHHCQRTVKKINLDNLTALKSVDWATFHSIKKEDVEGVHKKEIERQNVLHEIVQTEELYASQLNILDQIYREGLRRAVPPIIPPKKLEGFIDQVFGKLDRVREVNSSFLLPQLKYRQQEQGPWVVGFSDIFRDWIRKAKKAYVDYSAAYPAARFRMGAEERKNVLFASFVEGARRNAESHRLGYDTYLKSPITRLQRYGLLLQTVEKLMLNDSEEKTNLQQAIMEIKAVTLECDSRVAEMERKTMMSSLQEKLIMRPEIQSQVKLNLEHLGRELIYRGDLQRFGTNRFTWVETHAILFDHYLVLAKIVLTKDPITGVKTERYDVSKMPIPLQLLTLETAEDEPVVKSGLKGVTPVGPAYTQNPELRPGRTQSLGPPLSAVNSNNTLTPVGTNSSMVTATTLEKSDENILYPFKLKHLGQELYTLFAASAQARKEWCDKIVEAKTKHAQSLFAQNAEPFKLRVLADSAFAYETTGQRNIVIKGSPLSRAVSEVEQAYSHTARPPPVCRAKILCATTFQSNYDGKLMIAVGTDNGLYFSEMGNARGWSKVITIPKVTQVAVLEQFNLLLLLSDGALIAYHLDTIIPSSGTTPNHASDSPRKAPQKLSGSKGVGFFVTGRMKDRTIVIYKKREVNSSTFKILEPIGQKSHSTPTRSRSIFGIKGKTDFFRDFDEFYIGTNCSALTLFSTTLAVSTEKGFEVLNLDKKQPYSIPELKVPAVAQIAQALQGQETLAMFRLDDSEFLCVYEECAVYVDKHGDVSRSVVMQFVGRARAAALEAGFLVLFDTDFVEIRDAANGRLKQVVSGRDVRCLDDARGGTAGGDKGPAPATTLAASSVGHARSQSSVGGERRTVKFAMQHPEQERLQLVLELVLNTADGRA